MTCPEEERKAAASAIDGRRSRQLCTVQKLRANVYSDVLDLERRRPYANYIRPEAQQQQQLIHWVHVRGWSRSSSSNGWAAQEARIIAAERQELILGNEPLRRHTVAARVYYIASYTRAVQRTPFHLPATCTRPSLRRSAGGKLWTLSNQNYITYNLYTILIHNHPYTSRPITFRLCILKKARNPAGSTLYPQARGLKNVKNENPIKLAVPRIYPGRGEDETCARWDRSPSCHQDGPFEAASISSLVALRYYHVPMHTLQKLHREAFFGLHPCLTHRRNNCIHPRSIELIHNEGLVFTQIRQAAVAAARECRLIFASTTRTATLSHGLFASATRVHLHEKEALCDRKVRTAVRRCTHASQSSQPGIASEITQ
ncbi:unnamed protein product, partial [Trichogramma brassicae]